nr:hypothetical protein [Tanacetum cinerariifolium]
PGCRFVVGLSGRGSGSGVRVEKWSGKDEGVELQDGRMMMVDLAWIQSLNDDGWIGWKDDDGGLLVDLAWIQACCSNLWLKLDGRYGVMDAYVNGIRYGTNGVCSCCDYV